MELFAIALAALGFISIVGSIFIWNIKKGETAEEKAHAERFGIFIGLWAPTFFALAVLAKVMKFNGFSSSRLPRLARPKIGLVNFESWLLPSLRLPRSRRRLI